MVFDPSVFEPLRFDCSSFSTDSSTVVTLLQCYFVCAPVVYVAMSLFVPLLFFFWCRLGKAVLLAYGISWVPSFTFSMEMNLLRSFIGGVSCLQRVGIYIRNYSLEMTHAMLASRYSTC